MNMNAANEFAAVALAPTSYIADQLRDGLLHDVRCFAGSDYLAALRTTAADMATLAELWHDPRASRDALECVAIERGADASQVDAILSAAFPAGLPLPSEMAMPQPTPLIVPDRNNYDPPADESQSKISKENVAPISQLMIERASAINMRGVEWLWAGRIPIGAQTVLAGMPGTGKSTLTAAIVAIVTNGGTWPDGSKAPQGDVLLLSAEDSAGATLVPRLVAAGANIDRVHIIKGTHAAGKRQTFNLASDVELLERAATEIGNVRLIIVDPISAYFGSSGAGSNSSIRAILEPFGEFAERMGIAVCSVTHFTKSKGGAALNRVLGSIAITGAARAAYMVGKDPKDENRRVLISLKNNLAPEAAPIAYRLASVMVGNGVAASRVEWDSGDATMTAGDVLAAADGGGDRSARDEAVALLQELLAGGPVLQADIKQECDAAGVSWATVKRAKKAAGVIASREGEQGIRGGGRWFWHMQGDWPPSGDGQENGGVSVKGATAALSGSGLDASPLTRIEPLNGGGGS
jgi:putative DNA primase/helicase